MAVGTMLKTYRPLTDGTRGTAYKKNLQNIDDSGALVNKMKFHYFRYLFYFKRSFGNIFTSAKTQIFGNYSSESMKMMQAMGWKGGGLGADGEGMREPLFIKHRFDN